MDDKTLLAVLSKSREFVSPEASPCTAQLIGVIEADIDAGNELDANRLLMHLVVALAKIEKAARS